ncbi:MULTISPECIES: polyphosphate polymerase domain-containing protein [unclassified Paraflavitalea]|uniref:polyphosphate polymerase domain-containing protein n=1 Tax=unclassified Paraflavitalea TaxID=2798305 RepID=UPI003D349FAA
MNHILPYLHSEFAACNLEKINQSALLQSRMDYKFTCPTFIMEELLDLLKNEYEILAINNHRFFTYQTTYFDTPNLFTYHEHQRQKAHRFKIRYRNYVETATSMLEVKWKNAKGKTSKSRLQVEELPMDLGVHTNFFESNGIFNTHTFQARINVSYQRISLIHKTGTEKVTLDFNLEASDPVQKIHFPELMIVEVKAPGKMEAVSLPYLKKLGQREGGLSKYCLGTIALNPQIKHNLFKPLYSKILKLKNLYAAS